MGQRHGGRFVTGHAAKKFRASLEMLEDPPHALAHVALEMGFSSQSHVARLFSSLAGMTPAKYQKQVRRTIG